MVFTPLGAALWLSCCQLCPVECDHRRQPGASEWIHTCQFRSNLQLWL